MHRPDLVLVKPGAQKQLYGDLSAFSLTAIEPPLWAALLAADLRARGYGVELLDAEVECWTWEETAHAVANLNPRLAVLSVSGSNPSASTMNMIGTAEILRSLAEMAPSVPRCLTGLHPSALPERTMREEATDFVVQGEGFVTLPALVDMLSNGGTPASVPGLWYRDGETICHTERPADVDDLDVLPRPAWDLLPMEKYRAHNWHCFDRIDERSPYGVIYTSLGCPFRCSFCCINALFAKHGIRTRDPRLVVDEIEWVVNTWGIRNFKIIDEMFALNPAHVDDFCERIIERGLDLNMWAYARVNTVSQPMLAKMKAAGIHWVAYGFESGSRRVLEECGKAYDPDAVMDVVRMTYDEGQHICANFIFGLPEDDYDSMQETLGLAMEINAEWSNLYSTMAYPGSRLYTQAVDEGWTLPASWSGYSQYARDCLPLPTHHLTAGQVLGFRDYAFHAVHENPRYLNRLARLFGQVTADHVRSLCAHRLRRDHAG